MGNICSKSSNSPDAFAQPGRVLGAANTDPASTATPSGPRAPLPKSTSHTNWGSGKGGRTVGAGTGGTTSSSTPGTADARANAALAAQRRAESANQSANKGKLGSKLAAQKTQTQAQTLNEASRAEVAARDADGAAEARRWQ
ncbi:hypothetical protein ASPACDRAFT_118702 [Aspergillus aculeatus ATCC 16872]|uniref:Uncharacterized protein n=1 Tax=Aspergillus aculeatus (strain ATCC 16872 / CBS 172.66 / WB 5094) TaxID=690307 RepID=A0A1L9WWE0_ASPA1|nr:uncharacterized protein ASPACDRAFT_118702 [Aspergillus aculeatus ATCC 16872]OJK00443.1 hypothetical protein ASPACDRAFT_118702 [Aspergillus aculeatus ATCC 16872]